MANTYKVGSQLKYRCERGYLLDSGAAAAATASGGPAAANDRVASRRCTNDGTWTGETPNCTYVDCGLPEGLDNGDYALQNNGTTYYGSVVFYSCALGWRLDGFEKRTCQAGGRWEPEAPRCLETLCPALTITPAAEQHMQVNVTTLRIGGTATFACDHGYKLVGDPDLECLSSGSWSGWPPACVEIDCGAPYAVEHSKIFLVNEGSTKYGSSVEYTCDPGYTREGPFKRTCEITGYWSGQDPVCYIPKKAVAAIATQAPSLAAAGDNENLLRFGGDEETAVAASSSVGVWIGVALGLIVVIGLMIVGIYFYKKQQMLHRKPPITAAALRADNNNLGGGGFGGFVGGLMPSFVANGGGRNAGNHLHGGSQIGVRKERTPN
jgi:uncharacterized protein YneF (UPF0154 family)